MDWYKKSKSNLFSPPGWGYFEYKLDGGGPDGSPAVDRLTADLEGADNDGDIGEDPEDCWEDEGVCDDDADDCKDDTAGDCE